MLLMESFQIIEDYSPLSREIPIEKPTENLQPLPFYFNREEVSTFASEHAAAASQLASKTFGQYNN